MITKLTLTNYGTHKHSVMNFTGLRTGFRGENKAGKTWILKGLEAVLTCGGITENDRHVDPKTKQPAKESYIEVEWADGRLLRMSRVGATQTVFLQYADGQSENLTNIRQSAELVQAFTGVRPLVIDKERHYIQVKSLWDNNPFLVAGKKPATVLQFLTLLSPNPELTKAAREIKRAQNNLVVQREASKLVLEQAKADKKQASKKEIDTLSVALEDHDAKVKKHNKAVKHLRALTEARDSMPADVGATIKRYEKVKATNEKFADKSAALKKILKEHKAVTDHHQLLIGLSDDLSNAVSHMQRVKAKRKETEALVAQLVADVEMLQGSSTVCPNCGYLVGA